MTRLRVIRLGKHWWIVGDEESDPQGPYNTKAEANDTVRGLRRFEEGSTVSVDSPLWKEIVMGIIESGE